MTEGDPIIISYCRKVGIGKVVELNAKSSAPFGEPVGTRIQVDPAISHATFVVAPRAPQFCGGCGMLFIPGEAMYHDAPEEVDFLCQMCRPEEV